MISRLNRHCAYFSCHRGLEDCTFCYCPFYPCRDEHLGHFINTRRNKKIWSCEDCNWIHKKKVVDNIFYMVRRKNPKTHKSQNKLIPKETGVIILGHGSKLKDANDSLRRLAKELKRKNGLSLVEPAFLQFSQPDLSATIKKVAARGCRRIIIVPFFLFAGNHVNRDIPKEIRQAALTHKEVELIYAKNIGAFPKINNIVMDCIRTAAV